MKTLVSGATGFIGRRLMQNDFLALVRRPADYKNEILGDLRDFDSLKIACRGVDTIYHCAGYAHAFSSDTPTMYEKINLHGTVNLLEAAVHCGVKRFIFLSSVKAMAPPGENCVDENWPGEPNTPYGKSKRIAEEKVLEAGIKSGMHVVNLRLAMVYGRGGRGNLEKMVKALSVGKFPLLPETGNRRSLVHVNDVVSAIQLAAVRPEANGQTYIVADPRTYSGRELCETILATISEQPFTWPLPVWALRLAGQAGDLAEILFRQKLSLNSENISRLLDSEHYSPARIKRELGWQAQIGLKEGLQEMLKVCPTKK